jgi:flagellar protein FliO/FliZ
MRRQGGFLKGLFAAALIGMAAPALFAADDSKIIYPSGTPHAAAPTTPSATSGASTATLAIAILIAGVGAWLYWRNRKGVPGIRGAQNLVVEETKSLGNRQYLVVASYGHEKFLLGVCPGRIDLLSPVGRTPEGSEQ